MSYDEFQANLADFLWGRFKHISMYVRTMHGIMIFSMTTHPPGPRSPCTYCPTSTGRHSRHPLRHLHTRNLFLVSIPRTTRTICSICNICCITPLFSYSQAFSARFAILHQRHTHRITFTYCILRCLLHMISSLHHLHHLDLQDYLRKLSPLDFLVFLLPLH
jgi:hypothetical protein